MLTAFLEIFLFIIATTYGNIIYIKGNTVVLFSYLLMNQVATLIFIIITFY